MPPRLKPPDARRPERRRGRPRRHPPRGLPPARLAGAGDQPGFRPRRGEDDRPRDACRSRATARTTRRCGSTATRSRRSRSRSTAPPAAYAMEAGDLVLAIEGDAATVEIVTELNPRANTKLMGLYESGGMLCTQCEAEGFRRITFFPDRPDVLTRYRVRMTADKTLYPVLLSNGNRVAGRRAAGRPALGGMARSLPQALLSVRAGRRRPRRQSRQLRHPLGPQGRISASGCARPICRAPTMPWRR